MKYKFIIFSPWLLKSPGSGVLGLRFKVAGPGCVSGLGSFFMGFYTCVSGHSLWGFVRVFRG